MGFGAPRPLTRDLDLSEFRSGVETLDDWLVRRAWPNQESGASRTFVLCDADRPIGYYALASGAVTSATAPGRFRRNMPDPIPVAILARLAISQAHQGRGLGRLLFRDAGLRVLRASDSIGIRGLLTHAISEEAASFYLRLGMGRSPTGFMTFLVTLADLRATLA